MISDLCFDLTVYSLAVEPEFFHERTCRTALSESVINAYLGNLYGILFGKNITYSAAQTADDGMLFNREYPVSLLGKLKDSTPCL